MTLSGFLKRYVYIPLGGNRLGEGRTYLNLLVTMALGGLWHGANWTFVLWGVWNAGFLMLERFLHQRLARPAPPAWYAVPKMLVIVILGRLLFISSDLGTAFERFAGAFGGYGFALGENARLALTPERALALVAGLALCYIAPQAARLEARLLVWGQGLLLPLFWLAVAFVAARTAAPFLYFRF